MDESEQQQQQPSEPGPQSLEAKKEEGTTHLNLRVLSQNGNEIFFKMKPTTKLSRLMKAYCERQSISSSAVRFLYDGQRVQDEQTPADLDMEENDIIDVVLQQTGGTQ